MASWHRQQILRGITLRHHGRMHHATYYCSRLQNLSGESSYRFMILPSTLSPLAGEGGTLNCAPSADAVAGNGWATFPSPAGRVRAFTLPASWRSWAHPSGTTE